VEVINSGVTKFYRSIYFDAKNIYTVYFSAPKISLRPKSGSDAIII